jgi:Ser/Thr protein kinase RdoA (MazF antagonist)
VRGPNQTFRARTQDGVFYLRLYREVGRSRAEIEAELLALLSTGGNAAKPVTLADGGHVFQCPFQGSTRFAVLFTEALGAKPEPTPDNLRQIAAELARLHDRLRRVYPRRSRRVTVSTSPVVSSFKARSNFSRPSRLVPVSSSTMAQPARSSAARCTVKSWSVVETLA